MFKKKTEQEPFSSKYSAEIYETTVVRSLDQSNKIGAEYF